MRSLIRLGQAGKLALLLLGWKAVGTRALGPVSFLFLLAGLPRALRGFPWFLRQRRKFPVRFWKDTSAVSHYLRILYERQLMLATSLLYDRLGEPCWKNQITIIGCPPHLRSDFGSRGFVLAFLHTGLYPVVRYWLRSQGVQAAIMVNEIPPMLSRFGRQCFDRGDVRYGLPNVPHFFHYSDGMRKAINFLGPEKVLGVSLDGREASPSLDAHPIEAGAVYLGNAAARLAKRSQALILPVCARATAHGYEINFGEPLDEDFVKTQSAARVTSKLFDFLWPQVRAEPKAIAWGFFEAFASSDPKKITP